MAIRTKDLEAIKKRYLAMQNSIKQISVEIEVLRTENRQLMQLLSETEAPQEPKSIHQIRAERAANRRQAKIKYI